MCPVRALAGAPSPYPSRAHGSAFLANAGVARRDFLALGLGNPGPEGVWGGAEWLGHLCDNVRKRDFGRHARKTHARERFKA